MADNRPLAEQLGKWWRENKQGVATAAQDLGTLSDVMTGNVGALIGKGLYNTLRYGTPSPAIQQFQAGYTTPPAPTPTTPISQNIAPVDVGQGQANQMIAAQRGALAAQMAASRGALTQSAQAQQRQLATAMQQAQREYNLQRQQQQEQAFMQSRQLQQAAQARGLGQSGLAQLAQLQQGMQQGQLTNQAAQGMQQARLGYAEQARGTQQNLANQLMQLEASQQAGEANIAQQQFQTNLSLQDKSRSILTELYSVARAGQDMTDEDWNFLATQYGIAPEYITSLKNIWQQIRDAQ